MGNRPKVSILIPVYNTAQYLPKCMESVQNQTLREIEIIAVNDASPDNAAEVLAEYAAHDPRIKVVTHEKNGGILAARLSGIAAATGEFLIFLDADDFLNTDTARACYAKAKKTGADMIHFCFDVRVGHKKKPPFAREVEKRLRPYDGTLLGRRVFEGAFTDYLYRWNIAGKFIALEVCRKAAAALPPGYYIMAEDFCFYTLMSWYASHYEPLHKKCYHYGLEIGVSSFIQVDFKGFVRNCSVFTALNAVKTFLTSQGVFERYRADFEEQERKILDDLLDRWEHKLIRYDRIRGLHYMLENYSPAGLMRSMISYFAGREEDLAGLLGSAAVFPERSAPSEAVRHIGLYVEKASGEDLAARLVRCAGPWRDRGRKISILCPEGDLPDLPSGAMERIAVPAELEGSDAGKLIRRVGFWDTLREKYGIDTVVHGAVELPSSLFDAFCIKLSGLNLVAVPRTGSHLLTVASMGRFLAKMQTLFLADSIAVLSAEDRHFYEGFRLNCRPLDPPQLGSAVPPTRVVPGRKQLLWLGDFGSPDAEKTAAAWARMRTAFPEWKLCMAGYSPAGAALRGITTLAEILGIGDSLEFRAVSGDLRTLLAESALAFITAGQWNLLYAENAAAAGVPCWNGAELAPEELAEKLTALLQGAETEQAGSAAEKPAGSPEDLFDFRPLPGRPDAFPGRDLLEDLSSYRANYETFAILPEPRGATFVPVYRKLDRLIYRLLPPDSPRRDFFFRAARYLLKRLQKD